MAVSLTVAQLATALGRADDDADATRLHPVVTEMVDRYAEGAPEAISNESAIRTAGYMLAAPASSGQLRRTKTGMVDLHLVPLGNALRLSGSMALLSPYRQRRAIRAEATS